MSTVNHRFNYRQLLDRHSRIRIPMIQRDYAQGRPSALQVREEFLAAIEEKLKLPAADPSLPMNLDFIYGSVVRSDDQSRFLPLDGQQRLTTLFLLHWYLAWNDNRLDDFAKLFVTGGKFRFAYSVRQSSTEFFDALVSFVPDIGTSDLNSLSGFLANQPWYFRSWRLDPTIQSVLEMLDSIHVRFKGTEGLFGRLIDPERPPITFQLLDLESFELTDDLYIKMNARGKPLTPFETFKARYEQELKSQFPGEARRIGDQSFPIHEFVARRMDTSWLDLFWSKEHQSAAKVDENMFNVFRLVALITRDPSDEDTTNDLITLTATLPGYTVFHDRGWLGETFTRTLIPLLEFWSSGGSGEPRTALPSLEYLDERRAFASIKDDARSLDSNETLLFMAYVLFIREHEADIASEKMEEWMRVVFNFIVNANIERKERLPIGMSLILSLLPHSGDILEFLPEWEGADDLTGNLKQQAREEMSKASLMTSHAGWRPLILRAERHGYFRGQIQFLLEFSEVMDAVSDTSPSEWDDELHAHYQKSFEGYLKRSEAMFNGKGLVSTKGLLWERALLAIGDYTIDIGSQNRSLLVNAPSEQGSWKRLLRAFSAPEKASRKHLRALLSRLADDRPYEEQLSEIRETADAGIEPWRSAVIASPVAFEYGQRRIIRFSEDNLYLPKKTQMNGAHVELFSYCFYKNRLPVLQSEGALGPITIGGYEPAIGRDVEPFFVLNYQHDKLQCRLEVDVMDMECRIACPKSKVEKAPELKNALESLGELTELGDFLAVKVPRDRMEDSIKQLATQLADASV
jgi:hypothetical protein